MERHIPRLNRRRRILAQLIDAEKLITEMFGSEANFLELCEKHQPIAPTQGQVTMWKYRYMIPGSWLAMIADLAAIQGQPLDLTQYVFIPDKKTLKITVVADRKPQKPAEPHISAVSEIF